MEMNNFEENYYELLGLQQKAEINEIKTAFRKMQLKQTLNKKNSNAYIFLIDSKKKKMYDDYLDSKVISHNYSSSNNNNNVNLNEPNLKEQNLKEQNLKEKNIKPKFILTHSDDNDVIFKPSPINIELEISFKDAIMGCCANIKINRWNLYDGIKHSETEATYISIEPGTDENEVITVLNKGNINENVVGDVKVILKIKNDTIFKRNGLNLILEKQISLKESLCGLNFDFEHVNGKKYNVFNPPGKVIEPNSKKTFPKCGIQRGNHIGDLIVVFFVLFPSSVNVEKNGTLNELL